LTALIGVVELLASYRQAGCSAAHDPVTSRSARSHATRVDQSTPDTSSRALERGDGPDENPTAVRRVACGSAGSASRANK
jgi:hypothetical protein